jgi:hypothetical protein
MFADYYRLANCRCLQSSSVLQQRARDFRFRMQFTGVQEESVHHVLKQVLFHDLRQLSDRMKGLL